MHGSCSNTNKWSPVLSPWSPLDVPPFLGLAFFGVSCVRCDRSPTEKGLGGQRIERAVYNMPRDPKKGKATGKAGGKGKKKGDDDDDEVFFKSKTLQKFAKDSDGKGAKGKGARGGKGAKGGKRVIQAKSAAEAQQKVASAKKKAMQRKAQKKEYANFDELSDDELR